MRISCVGPLLRLHASHAFSVVFRVSIDAWKMIFSPKMVLLSARGKALGPIMISYLFAWSLERFGRPGHFLVFFLLARHRLFNAFQQRFELVLRPPFPLGFQ